MNIFVLYAHRTDYEHKFIELFSTMELLEKYIESHSEVQVDSIAEFELNPE